MKYDDTVARYSSSQMLLVGICFAAILLASQPAYSVSFTEIVVDSSQPAQPWMKEIADLDNDGKPDLIVCGRSGPVVWYKNPTWSKTVISTETGSGGTTTGIESGDIDGDGDIDVALANGYWYENPLSGGGNPQVGSWTRSQIGSISTAHDIYFGDLDGDGDLDAVKRDQGSSGNIIRLLRQDPSLAWTERQLTAFSGEGLALADIDHDSDLDVIIGSYWYENTGDIISGSWTRRSYTTAYTHPHVVVKVGNINGDAYPDIVLAPAEYAGNMVNLSWFEGKSNPTVGTMAEHVVEAAREAVVHSLQITDINSDGRQDLVYAEMHQGSDPDEVGAFINQDNGSTWAKEVYSSGGSHNVQAADLDGDGDNDFFGANHDGASSVKWWRNDSNPSYTLDSWQRHVIDAAKPWTAVFIFSGDINGDALPDIITGGWWYENPGTPGGTWTRHIIGSPLNNAAAIADFDHDGDLDILGTEGQGSNANSNFRWARNNGSGVFTLYNNIDSGVGDFLQGAVVESLAPGQLSVVLSWHQAGNGVQTLLVPADPTTGTWSYQQISANSQDEDLSSGDIDRDGDNDLLLGTKWLENTSGTWTERTLTGTSGNPDRNELFDINHDGRLDAIIGFEAISTQGKLAWYQQPLDATTIWTEHQIATPVGPMSVDVGDMDHDGDLDVVVGEHNLASPSTAGLFVYENNNFGTTWTAHSIHVGDEHHDGAQIVDIDLDGDLDIISIGWGHGRVMLYENRALTDVGPTDTDPPEIEAVSAIGNPNQVTLIFNEEVTTASAENHNNYSLSDGVAVVAANLQSDGKTVILTTTALAEAKLYTVTAVAIRDSHDNISGVLQAGFYYVAVHLTSDLEGYWPFEEGAGVSAADLSANGYHGQLQKGAGWTTGIIGKALNLDGFDDYVSLPNIDISGNGISISGWFRSSDLANCGSSNDCRIISKSVGTNENDHYWMVSTIKSGAVTRLRFRLKTSGTTTTLVAGSGDITESSWAHVVAVYDGSQMRLYKDSVLVGTTGKSGPLDTNSSVGVNIGRNPDGFGTWAGAIDDVRIYSRALTQEEITILYTGLSLDSDGDGIADSWEIYWFNNLTTADQTSDFDRDGYSDLQEYLNDLVGETDPLNGVYYPKTRNAPGGTGFVPVPPNGGFWLLVLPAIFNGGY